jgi:hypothetical protein
MQAPMIGRITRYLLALTILLGHGARADSASPAQILVYGAHEGANIAYHYSITNNGTKPIYSFTLGVRTISSGDTLPMLQRRPIGWQYGQTGETGTEILLSPSSTSQPSGWQAWFYGQEESNNYYLNWFLPTESQRNGVLPIQPGQTLSGFRVTLAKPDSAYLHSDVELFLGQAMKATVPLQLADTTPPRISVTLNPTTMWPPNNKLVSVAATVSVADDYDPAPEVKLESITSNETLAATDVSGAAIGTDDRQFALKATRQGTSTVGRIYTITYSAADGSGNRALASAVVTVPHDQGK